MIGGRGGTSTPPSDVPASVASASVAPASGTPAPASLGGGGNVAAGTSTLTDSGGIWYSKVPALLAVSGAPGMTAGVPPASTKTCATTLAVSPAIFTVAAVGASRLLMATITRRDRSFDSVEAYTDDE